MTSRKESLGSYVSGTSCFASVFIGSRAEQFLRVGSLVLPTRKVTPSVSVDLPSLIGAAGALPDLKLGPGGCRPGGRIQTHSRCICRLQREETARRHYMPRLPGLAVAGIQIDFRAIGGASPGDIEAEGSKRDRDVVVAGGADAVVREIPILCPGAIDRVDINLVAGGSAGGKIIDGEVEVIGRLNDVHAVQAPARWRWRRRASRPAGTKGDGVIRSGRTGMQSDRIIVCIGIFVGTKVVNVVHICLIVGGPLLNHAGCPCAESIAAAELIGVECATRAETIV